jgi:hypothetical protein
MALDASTQIRYLRVFPDADSESGFAALLRSVTT